MFNVKSVKSFFVGVIVGIALTIAAFFIVGHRYQVTPVSGSILKYDTWTDNVLVYAGDGWIKLESKIKDKNQLTQAPPPSAKLPEPSPAPAPRK